MYYLLVFHGNDGYANVTKYYVCMYSASVVLSNCNQPQTEFGIIGKKFIYIYIQIHTVTYRRGLWGFQNPSPKIPKALQNRAKLNPILKTVKNC